MTSSKTPVPEDCPNCRDSDDCPHLLAGDDCPRCETELVKPPAGKVECPNCLYVVNGQNQDEYVYGFEIPLRQANRLLMALGEGKCSMPMHAGDALFNWCQKNDVDPDELNDVLCDLRETGTYRNKEGQK